MSRWPSEAGSFPRFLGVPTPHHVRTHVTGGGLEKRGKLPGHGARPFQPSQLPQRGGMQCHRPEAVPSARGSAMATPWAARRPAACMARGAVGGPAAPVAGQASGGGGWQADAALSAVTLRPMGVIHSASVDSKVRGEVWLIRCSDATNPLQPHPTHPLLGSSQPSAVRVIRTPTAAQLRLCSKGAMP